jgi:hypothetical protein
MKPLGDRPRSRHSSTPRADLYPSVTPNPKGPTNLQVGHRHRTVGESESARRVSATAWQNVGRGR